MTTIPKSGEQIPAKIPQWKKNLLPPWQKGESANPRGRPKGAKNKICEMFLDDLLTVYTKRGKILLEEIARDNPVEFLKLIVKVLPKTFEISQSAEIINSTTVSLDTAQLKRIAENWLLSSEAGDT